MTTDETLGEMEARHAAAITAAGAPTEKEMREAEAPWPKTPEELSEYIAKLVDRPHDYGTCVYAMSLAAVAAFNYVSGRLGVTGFQASCADMDVIRRTRHMKHGFRILDAASLLYPQYDLIRDTREWIKEQRAQLADEAAKLLATEEACDEVKAHWREMARK